MSDVPQRRRVHRPVRAASAAAAPLTPTLVRACSDIGSRARQEDSYVLEVGPAGLVAAVIDGMGGHAGGDVASAAAAEALASAFRGGCRAEDLGVALTSANAAVRNVRRQPRLADAGATVAALALGDGHALVGWSGDCRIYRLRGRKLAQLTADHAPDESTVKAHLSNLESTLVRAGVAPRERALYLTLAEARCSSVVMKCLGATEGLDGDVRTIDARAGDAFLACTDGFVDHDTRNLKLTDATVATALRAAEDPARALVDAVLALGESAQDNLAAVVVRL